MALIKCPDCQKDVSDKAEKCPFCGCPINPSITNSPSETSAISYSYSKPAPSPKKIAFLLLPFFLSQSQLFLVLSFLSKKSLLINKH